MYVNIKRARFLFLPMILIFNATYQFHNFVLKRKEISVIHDTYKRAYVKYNDFK